VRDPSDALAEVHDWLVANEAPAPGFCHKKASSSEVWL
jgi:hypothetical protein